MCANVINNYATLVHMSGTHLSTGWMGGPYLPMLNAELEQETVRLLSNALTIAVSEHHLLYEYMRLTNKMTTISFFYRKTSV